MSKLATKSPLGGFSRDWKSVSLTELSDYELVSIAVAQGKDSDFEKRFKSVLKVNPPKPNQYVEVENGFVIWTGQNQYMLMMDNIDEKADLKMSERFGESAYCVLQSDGWACLQVDGPKIMDVLERFIPLDLRNAPNDFAARTVAHHIAVIVIKSPDGGWRLLTPRSSARSFLDALTHTTDSVIS